MYVKIFEEMFRLCILKYFYAYKIGILKAKSEM